MVKIAPQNLREIKKDNKMDSRQRALGTTNGMPYHRLENLQEKFTQPG